MFSRNPAGVRGALARLWLAADQTHKNTFTLFLELR